MKKELEELIKIKIAISLNRLLVSSKNYIKIEEEDDDIAKSYNKIALNADVRKATVSDTFNAKSIPSSTTLILIVEAMGFKLSDFSITYYAIKDIDIQNFRKKVKQEK